MSAPADSGPAVLVLAPMPAHPASAGNRRRLVATCEALARAGFSIDFAYYAHEDQIYRRFGQHPPTDFAAMQAVFRRVFLIEPRAPIPLKTRATHFDIDAWCPGEVGDFVEWYFSQVPGTAAILVNYVFLSRALERVPPQVLKLIDTHDRFAGRQKQYRPFRAEPNFFHTDEPGEARGLARADVVLAIQSAEARYFEGLTGRRVHLLPPRIPARRGFAAPKAIRRIGFIGHGNDANLFSIGRFAHAWAQDWVPGRPELVVAGEICASLAGLDRPGVRLAGYVESVAAFYEGVDVVVAPMLMGSGLKMKVAEALAFGVPVIGTRTGFEGFDPVDPAHRCRDVEEVAARLLALAEDPAALAALTEACADLFAAYDRRSWEAESGLIAMLREHDGGAPAAAPDEAPPRADAPVSEVRCGPLELTCEPSLRSLPSSDPDRGLLVATERRPADGTSPSYAPLRRRWFARAEEGDAASKPLAALGAMPVALSPEWVRDRALPPAARAALARAFAETPADWSAAARVVGLAEGRVEIVLSLPAFLASGTHPAAAFLLPADGASATELRIERVTPLRIRPGWRYADLTGRMPAPVPASVGFRHDGSRPSEAKGHLLLLTDDAIGRVDLFDEDDERGFRP